jgi:hypothetical protein
VARCRINPPQPLGVAEAKPNSGHGVVPDQLFFSMSLPLCAHSPIVLSFTLDLVQDAKTLTPSSSVPHIYTMSTCTAGRKKSLVVEAGA